MTECAILVTGGTGAARRLAETLAAAGWRVIYALAGATPAPKLPIHPNVSPRIGGFGGAQGLAAWLRAQGVSAVVDATHPHARAMPRQVAEAAREAGVPALRFLPPAPPLPKALTACRVHRLEDMAALLPRGARVFAALGSRGLSALLPRGDLWLHARMLSRPVFAPPPRWRLVIGAGGAPRATSVAERALLQAVRAQWVLARHAAGGARLLHAAAGLRIPALVLMPPPPPPGMPVAHTTREVLRWLVCNTI